MWLVHIVQAGERFSATMALLFAQKQICVMSYLSKVIWHLTHLSQMEFPRLINWTSLFPFNRLLGGIFHFYSNSKEHSVSKQWRPWSGIMRRLIWVYTVWPTKRMPGLYGLIGNLLFWIYFLTSISYKLIMWHLQDKLAGFCTKANMFHFLCK